MEINIPGLFYLIPAAGVLALVYAYLKSSMVNRLDAGTEEMKTIAGHIQEGAMAFLAREYKVLAIFVVIVGVLLAWGNASLADSHWLIGISFVCGAVCSGLSGYFGMRVATKANVRTTNAARESLGAYGTVIYRGQRSFNGHGGPAGKGRKRQGQGDYQRCSFHET